MLARGRDDNGRRVALIAGLAPNTLVPGDPHASAELLGLELVAS